ncbi:MAG: hypothetical protein ACRDOK_04575 [Streptosporangiaceae bacterium]
MDRIEVHPMTVRGQEYAVSVDGLGQFHAQHNSRDIIAITRDALGKRLTDLTKTAQTRALRTSDEVLLLKLRLVRCVVERDRAIAAVEDRDQQIAQLKAELDATRGHQRGALLRERPGHQGDRAMVPAG